jgi:hypothetical protein
MKRTLLYTLGAWIFCIGFLACKKSVTTANSAITIENISGTYALKGLVWSFGGFNFNVFDSLDACEKDNLIKFNTDKTVNYIDAGTACTPPADDNGTWDLQGDSLIFSSNYSNAKIQSFDGKTLILTGVPEGESGTTATTTLEKQ